MPGADQPLGGASGAASAAGLQVTFSATMRAACSEGRARREIARRRVGKRAERVDAARAKCSSAQVAGPWRKPLARLFVADEFVDLGHGLRQRQVSGDGGDFGRGQSWLVKATSLSSCGGAA